LHILPDGSFELFGKGLGDIHFVAHAIQAMARYLVGKQQMN
jgi:hypothetical protein